MLLHVVPVSALEGTLEQLCPSTGSSSITWFDWRSIEVSRNLFEVVKGREDDVMAAPHKANGRQQLQDQSFGPEDTQVHSGLLL